MLGAIPMMFQPAVGRPAKKPAKPGLWGTLFGEAAKAAPGVLAAEQARKAAARERKAAAAAALAAQRLAEAGRPIQILPSAPEKKPFPVVLAVGGGIALLAIIFLVTKKK